MKRTVLAAAIMATTASQAQCPLDFSGTKPTSTTGQTYEICGECREINAFPQDLINFTWNEVMHGDYWYAYEHSFGALQTTGSQTKFQFRPCNGLGQCATVTFTTNFVMETQYRPPLQPIDIRVNYKNWKMVVRLPSGEVPPPTVYTRDDKPGELPVPATAQGDGYEEGQCVTNLGAEIVSEMPVGTPPPGGGSTTVTPMPSGWSGDGYTGHTRECWRIVTRDGTGKVIGDEVQCVLM